MKASLARHHRSPAAVLSALSASLGFLVLVLVLLLGSGSAHADGVASIWTDKPDYSPGEVVVINGAGFVPNVTVAVSVTRPDSTTDAWDTSSSESGAFITTYQLDGIVGSYLVLATDGTNTASTTFTDADNQPPTFSISFPPPTGMNGWFATSPVTGSLTAHDDGQIDSISCTFGSVSYTLSSNKKDATGSVVVSGEGAHTFSCSATDKSGNTATVGPFTIRIDTGAPTLTLPSPILVEAASPTGAMVTYSASAADAVSGLGSLFCSPTSGSTFPLGVTTVSCTARDVAGNSATGEFSVTVRDTTPPGLSLPGDQTVEATGPGGAVVTFSASASDLVDGPVSVSCNPAPGSTFALGISTVSCSATDHAGNSATGSFHVTVRDTTPPAVTVPGSMTLEATGPAGASATFAGSAVDVVDGSVPATCSPPSGSTFAIGTTAITCTATDSHGNTGSASFVITVQDTTPPVLALPSDIEREATGPGGAEVSYVASASDIVDGAVTTTCSPPSGSLFALGDTTVDCSAADAHGNHATGSFRIRVVDTTAPSLSLPADIVAEATGPSGAPVGFTASAFDVVDGATAVTCLPGSGATFSLGSTLVQCSSTDAHGNAATGSFSVRVRDTTPPVLTLPGDLTIEASGSSGASVSFGAFATDLVDGSVAPVCTPGSGSTFPLGPTVVWCTATDGAGNTATGSFQVTVEDTTPPVVTVPSDMTTEATGPSGAEVAFSASAIDLVDGPIAAVCVPGSGSTFPLGTTFVTCHATDAHHNTGDASFSVTVQDTTPPEVTVPSDLTLEATGPSGAVASFGSSALDLVDGALTPTCTPSSGSTFALGSTLVSCVATDTAGNSGSATFYVTVQDTTPPVLSVPGGLTLEATSATGATVTFSASASDVVDGSVAVSCTPVSGATFALGSTLVSCSATDAHGNTGFSSFLIVVVDTTPPALSLPGDTVAEATGPVGAVVSFAVSANDIVDGAVFVECVPASGSTFGIATTSVSCHATDTHGNTASGTFQVTVRDTTPPAVSVPSTITGEATGPAGAGVAFPASAFDVVDGPLAATCTPASGSTFSIGGTTVHCAATDAHGNTGSASFLVIVEDTTPPNLVLPGGLTREATSAAGAVATFLASATDIVDGNVPVVCSPPSGATLPLGSTSVSCDATDAHGNTATGSFLITVIDTTPPTIHVSANIVAAATGSDGAHVSFSATADDLVDGSLTPSCEPASGSTFAIGTTTVTCRAADAHGNTASGSFTITVILRTAPLAVTCTPGSSSANPAILNGAAVCTVTVSDGGPAPYLAPSGPVSLTFVGSGSGGAIAGSFNPASALCTLSGSGMTATCSVTFTANGIGHGTLTATYGGDSTHTGSAGTTEVYIQYSRSCGRSILAPLEQVSAPSYLTKAYKTGSTLPIKLQLCDASGAYVGSATATVAVFKISNGVDSSDSVVVIDSGSSNGNSNVCRYDSTGQQYVYNLSTKGYEKGTYRLDVSLDDGTKVVTFFQLTR